MSNETVTINDIQIPISAILAAGFTREVKQGGRFKPKNGETYWYFYSDGEIDRANCTGTYSDNHRRALGNCYRTKAEAIAARDVQLALVRVQDKLEELTDEPLDWNNVIQFQKGAIGYDYTERRFVVTDWQFVQMINGLYGSRKACEWVMENMESDLKLIEGIA